MAGQYPENVEVTPEVQESYRETYISNMKYASSRLELVSDFSLKLKMYLYCIFEISCDSFLWSFS